MFPPFGHFLPLRLGEFPAPPYKDVLQTLHVTRHTAQPATPDVRAAAAAARALRFTRCVNLCEIKFAARSMLRGPDDTG